MFNTGYWYHAQTSNFLMMRIGLHDVDNNACLTHIVLKSKFEFLSTSEKVSLLSKLYFSQVPQYFAPKLTCACVHFLLVITRVNFSSCGDSLVESSQFFFWRVLVGAAYAVRVKKTVIIFSKHLYGARCGKIRTCFVRGGAAVRHSGKTLTITHKPDFRYL